MENPTHEVWIMGYRAAMRRFGLFDHNAEAMFQRDLNYFVSALESMTERPVKQTEEKESEAGTD